MKLNRWPRKPIGEIAHCSLGKMLDKQKNRGMLRPYLRNVNVRWFEFDLSDVLQMRFEDDEAEKFTAKKGDVLICEGGYPGRSAIWEGDEPIFFQKAIHRVRFHEPERNKWFLYFIYFLESTGELQQQFTGTGIQHFTGQVLKRLQMPLPPLPEQRRIVGILDEAFAAIATAKANTQTNLRNARAVFDSEVAEIFTDLSKSPLVALGDICDFENGDRGKNYPNKSEYVPSGVPWINTGHICPDGTLSVDEMNYISEAKFKTLRSGKIRAGDLVYCLRGATLGKTALVEPFTAGAVASSLVIIRPSEAVERHYLFYFLTSSVGRGLIKGYENGAAQPNLGAKSVAKFKLPLPSRDEQKIVTQPIVGLASETQRLAALYQQKLAALDALKKSLLHQAFSGQLSGKELAHAG